MSGRFSHLSSLELDLLLAGNDALLHVDVAMAVAAKHEQEWAAGGTDYLNEVDYRRRVLFLEIQREVESRK